MKRKRIQLWLWLILFKLYAKARWGFDPSSKPDEVFWTWLQSAAGASCYLCNYLGLLNLRVSLHQLKILQRTGFQTAPDWLKYSWVTLGLHGPIHSYIQNTVADPSGGQGGHAHARPQGLQIIVIKKVTAERGRLYFVFYAPLPFSKVSGSDPKIGCDYVDVNWTQQTSMVPNCALITLNQFGSQSEVNRCK